MKLIPAVAIAVAAFAVSATVYAKDCGNRPAKLSVPDGKTASEEQMKATQAKLPGYAQAMSAYMRCLSDEIKVGKDEYDSVSSEWKQQSDAFAKTPAK